MGSNINGPSLIRAPTWLRDRKAELYLYFADHSGDYIRLALADDVAGPWTMYEPGTLTVSESYFEAHVASPDVHIEEERRRLRMYVHGPIAADGTTQGTRVATSHDGVVWTTRPEVLGLPYFRVFRWADVWWAIAMPGVIYRSVDGLGDFEPGPWLFDIHFRHGAVLVRGDTLHVFFTRRGDCPERVLHSTVDLRPAWTQWSASKPVTVLEPELDYEGANLPLSPSEIGEIREPARQLRDPCVFVDRDEIWLLYCVAGESGIAAARLTFDE